MSLFPYGYHFGSTAIDEWAMQFVVAIVAVVFLLASLVGLAFYVLQAVAVYRIAKRRCLKHAWLAWLPVGRDWLLGCISDQYQYVVKGQIRNRRFVMLILAALTTALGAIMSLGSFGTIGSMISALFGIGDPNQMQVVAPVMAGSLATLFNSIASVVYLVFFIITLHDLYASCNPGNAVVFLILGIIFSFLRPIFIFTCRNKDDGMPPRRPQPTPTWQSQNGWNNP